MGQIISGLRAGVQRGRRALMIGMAAPDRARRRTAARAYLSTDAHAQFVQADVLAQMEVEGFASWQLAPARTLELIRAYEDTCADRVAGRSGAVERSTGKAFFQETLTHDDLARRSAFIDLALEPRLLATVTAIAGLVPHLESVEVYVSEPRAGGLSASQLWHRDVNDRMTIKLFVYLNDVGVPNGPFTFIPAQYSARVPGDMPHYMTDAQIAAHVALEEWRSIAGPAGTAFLIDTRRCLHYGSRCTAPRIAYIATFSSGLKFTKFSHAWQSILSARNAQLDPLQRMVCGIDKIRSRRE